MRAEKRLERLEFYVTMLLDMVEKERYPFYYLVMKKQLEKQDIEGLLKVCSELNKQYEAQKAEGLLLYDPLLTTFEKMLPQKLDLQETVEAMEYQGLFKPLMREFLSLIKR
ncbi:DUF1878 family protein [Microbacteriaceae bacterium 4G12]